MADVCFEVEALFSNLLLKLFLYSSPVLVRLRSAGALRSSCRICVIPFLLSPSFGDFFTLPTPTPIASPCAT